MSNREDDDIIKNRDTVMRRAWVARALEGARRRLQEKDEAAAAGSAAEPATGRKRPMLYLVHSSRER